MYFQNKKQKDERARERNYTQKVFQTICRTSRERESVCHEYTCVNNNSIVLIKI